MSTKTSSNFQAGEKCQGAVPLGFDLAKAFERVRLPVVWACATNTLCFCGCYAGTASIRDECSLNDVWWRPLHTIPAILPGSKWGCLLQRIVLQDALSDVTEFSASQIQIQRVCLWMTSQLFLFLRERNKELAEKVWTKLKKVWRRKARSCR